MNIYILVEKEFFLTKSASRGGLELVGWEWHGRGGWVGGGLAVFGWRACDRSNSTKVTKTYVKVGVCPCGPGVDGCGWKGATIMRAVCCVFEGRKCKRAYMFLQRWVKDVLMRCLKSKWRICLSDAG